MRINIDELMVMIREMGDAEFYAGSASSKKNDEKHDIEALKASKLEVDIETKLRELQSRLEAAEKDAAKYAKLPINEWQEFEYWLDRCHDKGHLENCSDLIDPYHRLSTAIAAMQSNQGASSADKS